MLSLLLLSLLLKRRGCLLITFFRKGFLNRFLQAWSWSNNTVKCIKRWFWFLSKLMSLRTLYKPIKKKHNYMFNLPCFYPIVKPFITCLINLLKVLLPHAEMGLPIKCRILLSCLQNLPFGNTPFEWVSVLNGSVYFYCDRLTFRNVFNNLASPWWHSLAPDKRKYWIRNVTIFLWRYLW